MFDILNYLKLFDLKVFHYLYYKFDFLFYLKINRIIKNFRKTYVKLGHNSQLIPIPKKFLIKAIWKQFLSAYPNIIFTKYFLLLLIGTGILIYQ